MVGVIRVMCGWNSSGTPNARGHSPWLCGSGALRETQAGDVTGIQVTEAVVLNETTRGGGGGDDNIKKGWWEKARMRTRAQWLTRQVSPEKSHKDRWETRSRWWAEARSDQTSRGKSRPMPCSGPWGLCRGLNGSLPTAPTPKTSTS